MKTKTTSSSAITVGLDLGDRKHAVCVLDAKGKVLKQESITNTRGSLTALSRRHPRALVVMEVGMHSPWTSRFLESLGHRVLVANPWSSRQRCEDHAGGMREPVDGRLGLGRRPGVTVAPMSGGVRFPDFRDMQLRRFRRRSLRS